MYKIAKRLFDRGQITQEEFDSVKGLTKEAFAAEAAAGAAKKAARNMFGVEGLAHGIKDVVTALGLGAIGVSLGQDIYGKAKQGIESHDAYERMLKKIPDLKEYPQDEVRDYYDVVKTFSPRSAANPLVAGALVNKMVQFGGVDHKIIQDLASIEGPKKDIILEIATKAGGAWAGPGKED